MNVIDREIEKRIRQKPNFQDIIVSARAFEGGIVKTGLNYCSKVFRFTIYYEKRGRKCVKSFFVKAPYGLRYHELIKQFRMYAKEIYMYNAVLPLFKALLPNHSLQPEFYGTDGAEALILEDLSYSGYKLLEGHKQMDFEHSVLALKLLARFHALGVKVHQSEPQILHEAGNEYLMTSDIIQRKDLCDLFNARVEKVVRRAAPIYADQHPQVLHFFKNDSFLLEALVEELRPEGYSFQVLNHGDFHTYNIMFADDEFGQVNRAKCLDFQSCRWSSPALDIIYFCISSVRPPVFQKYLPLLLEIYMQTLNATLEHLECEVRLDSDVLSKDIEKINACWFHALIWQAPLIVSDLRNASDDILAEEYMDDEYYIQITKFWVPYFIEKGLFTKYEEAAAAANYQLNSEFPDTKKSKISINEGLSEAQKADDDFLSGFVLLSFNSQNSVFLKIPSIKNCSKMMDPVGGTHCREIFMFENVLPQIFEPWSGQHYAPLCHAITKTKGLILEDLEAQGYRTCDSKKQLDLPHCRVALATLAKFHALSVTFVRSSNQSLVDTLTKMPDYSPSLTNFGNQLYNRFLGLTQTLVPKSAHQKLCEYKTELEDAWEALSEATERSSGFSVIAHGNFWTNNILFKYDDRGRVHQAKMVDWQMSRVASPVLDLVYFFTGSVPIEIFSAHRNTLLNLYVDTLNETLSLLKCNCTYTRAELETDLSRYKALFPMFASSILQVVMTERDQQIFNLKPSNEISCGKYPIVVAKWLNYFIENGIV